MELQSARITKQVNGVWKDHKDIIGYYNGKFYHHDAIYKGNELVWRKIKDEDIIDTNFFYSERRLESRNATPFYYGIRNHVGYLYGEKLETEEKVYAPLAGNLAAVFSNWFTGSVFPVWIEKGIWEYSSDFKNWENAQLPRDHIWTENYIQVLTGKWDAVEQKRLFVVKRYVILNNLAKLKKEYFNIEADSFRTDISGVLGFIGDAIFGIGVKKDVFTGLGVVDGNITKTTAFDEEKIQGISHDGTLRNNMFFSKTSAYILSNTPGKKERTLYKLGGLGTLLETYIFETSTMEPMSLYVYKDRYVAMSASGSATLYLYDMKNHKIETYFLMGYQLLWVANQSYSGMAEICYEDENGLNIVLCKNNGLMSLFVLKL